MTTLEKLTKRLRELVPELLHETFCLEKGHKLDKETFCGICKTSNHHRLYERITLEHCRVAWNRQLEEFKKLDPEKYLEALINYHWQSKWQDLQPWESQTEVHKFLEQSLLNDSK